MKLTSVLLLLMSFSLVACGDDDSNQDEVLEHCADFCDNQGSAANCPDEVANEDVQTCKQLCGPVVAGFDADCQAVADALYLCSSSKDTWECQLGGNLPVQTDDSCKAEFDAYSSCFGNQ